LAQKAYNITKGIKAKKVICMPTIGCLAKIDDKCALFAPGKQKNTEKVPDTERQISKYRRNGHFHSEIVGSLTAWLGEKRKTGFS